KLLEIKRSLTTLGRTGRASNDLEKDIITKIKAYPLKIPKTALAKKDFYQNLAANARLQTGLHDHFREGLQRYFPYQTALTAYFKNFNMPPELLAISFVESSFNPKAQSFVGALGIWQFMPKIGRHFLPMTKDIDGRKNPLLATLGALHLLQENYQIFKRWDLAISAYNSGTKHLLLAKKKVQNINRQQQKKFGKKAKLLVPDLATLLQNYDHPHLGFASKNYYSEFLAMQWSLAYREQLFVNLPQKTKDYGMVNVYLTCQSMSWEKIKKWHSTMKELNNHIAPTTQNLNQGTIILSNQPLPAPQFMLVPDDIQRRFRPVRWVKALQKEQRWCNQLPSPPGQERAASPTNQPAL
ncbi:MAG: lytic transglycosylase domain-containing protein, partial [Bacteriovoracaceae bacterium]|nr:lytic transglycosylase domain-containing protein [Bacteriovoracaceae bacterium]